MEEYQHEQTPPTPQPDMSNLVIESLAKKRESEQLWERPAYHQ